MFYNELELLKIRLYELYYIVDHIILVEATMTHSGNPKPLFYSENKDMFKEYNDKIIHLVTDFIPKHDFVENIKKYLKPNTVDWYREHYQRECIQLALNNMNLNDDDIIILTDIDEIPNRILIQYIKNDYKLQDNLIYIIEMKIYYYNIELTVDNKWFHGKIFNYKTYKNNNLLTYMRLICSDLPVCYNGGWHLSYFGNINFIKNKVESFAESQEYSLEGKYINYIKDCLDKSILHFNKKQLIHIPLSSNTLTPRFFQKKGGISYVCLIYKSTKWLEFLHNQFNKYTTLNEHDEFYFVANDAYPEVLNYLLDKNIPHYTHNNTQEQIKNDWYINNVYRAWNTAAKKAKGEYIVFLNSDFAFSPKWNKNLIKNINDNICITSRLVERGVLRSGLYGIEKNFGNNYNDYDEKSFIEFAETIKEDNLYYSGLYMPLLVKKSHIDAVGYYPEGNVKIESDIFNPIIAKKGDDLIPGDQVLMAKLKSINVKHVSAFDSIVYHFQEGEMRE